MDWLALMKKVPPEYLKAIEEMGDLEQYIPVFNKFIAFKKLAVDTQVGNISPDDVMEIFSVLDVPMPVDKAASIAAALRRFCPSAEANVMTFLREGGLKHVMKGIATPQENLDTDNSIRCPHCHGLIVRVETEPGFDDLIRCQHCGGIIINY